MKMSRRLATTLAAAAVIAVPRSKIESATVRNPQSAVPNQSAIRNPQSTIQSAIRNPQSAIREWRSLFDGHSLEAWRGYKADKIPDGWHIANGTLAKEKPVAD